MSIRKVSRRRLKKYVIGDMRERIKIHTRFITAPVFDSAELKETYDTGNLRWAVAETLDYLSSGRQMFDEVNLNKAPSHKFTIRYDADITTENIINWQDEYYQIIKTINPDVRKQYLELFCRVKGSEGFEVNR